MTFFPHESAAALRGAVQKASDGLIERGNLVESVVLAAVAGEHLLVIGPPGTAKSEAVRRVCALLGGDYFEYLLGRFTEPSEIFGPVDLRKLREGIVETETAGMLPEADIAFLDEIFQGSTAILNTLLGILNERVFRRGHTQMKCPLRLCVAASNALPDDESLAAFSDRFLLRVFVAPIPDPRLEELLEGGWQLGASTRENDDDASKKKVSGANSAEAMQPRNFLDGEKLRIEINEEGDSASSKNAAARVSDEANFRAPNSEDAPQNTPASTRAATLSDIDALASVAAHADLTEVRPHLAHAIRLLRSAGIHFSDRRAVKTQKLIAAAAALDGRITPTAADLWPLLLAVPTHEGQILARETLHELLQETRNAALLQASEDASRGPLARAQRLSADAAQTLSQAPQEPRERAAWQQKLEGITREIDAGFSSETLPPELSQARQNVLSALSS